MTPRTHSVTGPAWNKLAEVLSQQWKTKRSDTVRQNGYANCVTRSALPVIASDEDAHE